MEILVKNLFLEKFSNHIEADSNYKDSNFLKIIAKHYGKFQYLKITSAS